MACKFNVKIFKFVQTLTYVSQHVNLAFGNNNA